MAETLSGYMLAIAKESLDVFNEHRELRNKHNMGETMINNKEELVKENLKKAFDLIGHGNAFYQF